MTERLRYIQNQSPIIDQIGTYKNSDVLGNECTPNQVVTFVCFYNNVIVWSKNNCC